mmetsp:Transcript_82005/g.228576  ORF Transcript_82005/g.228576 Transcript_82005/m.228576 type:complete len:232 (+) Transcript_82005:91-786(+)
MSPCAPKGDCLNDVMPKARPLSTRASIEANSRRRVAEAKALSQHLAMTSRSVAHCRGWGRKRTAAPRLSTAREFACLLAGTVRGSERNSRTIKSRAWGCGASAGAGAAFTAAPRTTGLELPGTTRYFGPRRRGGWHSAASPPSTGGARGAGTSDDGGGAPRPTAREGDAVTSVAPAGMGEARSAGRWSLVTPAAAARATAAALAAAAAPAAAAADTGAGFAATAMDSSAVA